MFKKIKTCVLHTVLAALCLSAVGCGSSNKVVDKMYKYVPHVEGEAYVPGDGLNLVAEGDTMQLYLDAETATIRWQNKKSGDYLDTRIFDDAVSDKTLKSDLIVNYFTGASSTPYETYTNMASYEYSVEMDTVQYEKMDNGVRIIYNIGSDAISWKDFPAIMSEERMETLIFSKCTEKEKTTIKKHYRQVGDGSYTRVFGESSPIAGLAAKQLYELFYVTCGYTLEELETDNREWGKLDQMPARQNIQAIIEYYLDGDELVVRLPIEEMSWTEDFPLKSFDLLPYFLSTKDTEDGYLFVPDGSGALLYLDNTKIREYQFESRYWNGDPLIDTSTYSTTKATMTAPVYGIKTKNYAVLGIIEDGAEIATLKAYINGSYNSIPYSRVSLSFAIREDQTLANFVDATANYTLKKASDDYYADDVIVRYSFLTGDDADYVGMANTYKNYLLKNGKLAANEAESEAPVFVEMLGLVDSTEYLLGIPYEGTTSLTTFTQAQDILADMNSRGIKNIKLDYQGAANGGLSQRTAESVEIASELGGKSGFNKLVSYAQSIGADVFPNFQLQTATESSGFNKDKKAFFINGQVAELYSFEPVQFKAETTADYPTYVISPSYFKTYIEKFNKSYSKLGYENLASEDFMKFYVPTYRKDQNVNITTAMPTYHEMFDLLSSNYRLMLSNPVSEAWKGVTYISDLPTSGINLKVIDCYVPFIQLVLSGNIVYSTPVMNTNSHDMTAGMMKAFETGSAMKFRFIATDTNELQNTVADNVFLAEYNTLKDNVAGLYAEYASVYEQIQGASLVDHEVFDGAGELVCVTYSNGVQLYLNYTENDAQVGGVKVPAGSYVVR